MTGWRYADPLAMILLKNPYRYHQQNLLLKRRYIVVRKAGLLIYRRGCFLNTDNVYSNQNHCSMEDFHEQTSCPLE